MSIGVDRQSQDEQQEEGLPDEEHGPGAGSARHLCNRTHRQHRCRKDRYGSHLCHVRRAAVDELVRDHDHVAGDVSREDVQSQKSQHVDQPGDEAEKREFLESLGLAETGLARVIRAGYALLGLVTFFTVGPKEAKAWTVTKGSKAPQAAGVIHTDFEKGFIRAETIAYDDFVACGGEQGAKDAGKMHLEGAEYLVQDGDVFYFRFNV